MNPAGLEPAIPGSVGRCLIHWATGPHNYNLVCASLIFSSATDTMLVLVMLIRMLAVKTKSRVMMHIMLWRQKNEVNCAYPVNQTGIVEEPTEEFPRVFEGAHV